mmetsp:Transcript_27032/g.55631  ORF Transcript_27032/g.55631 Transcript_27032/m.55631 type:complete len:82 (-) Transcript_27032:1350-1595(-)
MGEDDAGCEKYTAFPLVPPVDCDRLTACAATFAPEMTLIHCDILAFKSISETRLGERSMLDDVEDKAGRDNNFFLKKDASV